MPRKSGKKKQVKKEPVIELGYTVEVWKGVVPVYSCKECPYQVSRDEGDIILHVAEHAPAPLQEEALEKLIKAGEQSEVKEKVDAKNITDSSNSEDAV